LGDGHTARRARLSLRRLGRPPCAVRTWTPKAGTVTPAQRDHQPTGSRRRGVDSVGGGEHFAQARHVRIEHVAA
jgi:hypothetical protein